MRHIFGVLSYTLKEHIRHRVYLSTFLFAAILSVGGLIVSSLAADEQIRMMIDLGLSGIEFLSLVTVVFVTVNLVLDEMDSKSIYLILSHPIQKWKYILGRFLGTMLALLIGMAFMALLHIFSLYLKGWSLTVMYPTAILCSALKIFVIGSLALLISLITTSSASAMTVTGFLWVMGHFSTELRFMAEKSLNPIVKTLVWIFRQVSPDFSYFNYRDFWSASVVPTNTFFMWLLIYSVAYVSFCLFLTSWLFSKKEF